MRFKVYIQEGGKGICRRQFVCGGCVDQATLSLILREHEERGENMVRIRPVMRPCNLSSP